MNGHIECPACGHELSMFDPPEPARGERAAGWVAARLATWWAPTIILVAVAAWVVVNVADRPFEPYPVIVFAVISAVLATMAALQGPLILLAQRRAAMNDRARDEETFRVAINSEADLHRLSLKLDEVLSRLER